MTTTKNPLLKHFRQPAIYIKLPSNGQYWRSESIDLPVTGELPVYPLSTRDEITLKTPDALMNGAGIVDVIQSCLPGIKNAWDIPSVDIDAILIAIRIASYGEIMDIDTNCPYCNEENTHGINLQNCLAAITCPDYTKRIDLDGLKIKLKPLTYFGNNKVSLIEFEQQKMLQALERADIDNEVRAAEIYSSVQKLMDIGSEILVTSTDYIEMEDSTRVTDHEFIKEFYSNASSSLVKKVRTSLEELGAPAGVKPQNVCCGACNKSYDVPVLFEYSAFFGQGS